MKFAVLALVASTSAIQIRAEADKCHGSMADTNEAFDHIDTNHNGSINQKELTAAVEWVAKKMNHKITKKEWEWLGKTAGADAGKDQVMNKKEFNKFANTFVNHFGLCKEVGALAEVEEAKCHGSMKDTDEA